MADHLTLPYDIYCLVLDMIATEETHLPLLYSTLRACALTCPSWIPRAHFHLYRRVVLPTRRAFLCFARTISHSSHFAPLVEHIDVKVSPAHDCGWPHDHRQIDVSFPRHALDQLVNLKSARFTSSFQFAQVPESLVAFVRAFAPCGGLRKLSFHRFFFPEFRELVITLWSFPRATSLSVVECGWCTPRSILELPDANAFPARCHSLNILLISKCCFTNPILDVVKTSIHDLSLWASGDRDQCQAISSFPALRRLTLAFSMLQWAVAVLAHVRSEHVREIKLRLNANCFADEESVEDVAQLDEILSRAPFLGLRRLTIIAQWPNARKGREYLGKRWTLQVHGCLPECHKRGVLRVPIQ
ncbi:hypothetical protein BD311DRAFT_764483 [Dichomitus squalens]|uniref:F-box domain-containing protein n=1 Tax=Dichomitus squalens TaxID=114155 RepID=A0A4Q9ME62_9APHY|nr:hypothetical protein BD311DRAFT_764483 [Dichomitus squalens]